jgi:hypothetical protein
MKKASKQIGTISIPMRVNHLPPRDDVKERCRKCWVSNPKPGHFCLYNLRNDPGNTMRGTAPYNQPVFERVKEDANTST